MRFPQATQCLVITVAANPPVMKMDICGVVVVASSKLVDNAPEQRIVWAVVVGTPACISIQPLNIFKREEARIQFEPNDRV
ncbi:hypothetical protein EGR_06132 [Echinococcus granulosus]|uniref:Uncharacterized protein n=1 Tax=Echinococcus granulosus TaxID=6210 RepID=W6UDV4_ECHGR|nr:hypothetical protein EGR_06132 [Echinococcus granulosus]EUB59016.1 hypothetical protein EGR_06132 [Echinococcus granulosus]